MKELIRKSVVLALLFTALQGNARVNPTLRNLKDGKTTVLTLSGVEEGDSFYIKDLFGQVLYEHSISVSGVYERTFNLTVFDEGSYYFEVTIEDELRRIPFNVVNKKIVIEKNKESAIMRQAKRVNKKQLKQEKRSTTKRTAVRDVPRRPSFKGQNFEDYYKRN
ncbi:MAG: hypothetical protein AAF693_10765 [Bacteroidota bacterium]